MIGTGSNQLQGAVDRARPNRSFADYAAMAVCPGLIIVAVESLIFFLVQIGYGGPYVGRLRWTLFWFSLAMVLVSRIAIEKGREHAGIYGIGLAGATGFVLLQYVGNYLGVWCLLGMIWWATNKLTWDCTVIDDDQDASGEGLLQAARLDAVLPAENPAAQGGSSSSSSKTPEQGSAGASPHQAARSAAAGQASSSKAKTKSPNVPWWQRAGGHRPDTATRPHAPGRWVIYFSLGALPIFGIGQRLIPVQDAVARRYAFLLLILYVAAALGLLLMTSFLGLRRYLRQRHLQMPAAMSASWTSLGTVIGLSVLVVCILLPRPNAEWTFLGTFERLEGPGSTSKQEAESAPEGAGQGEREVPGKDKNQTAVDSQTATENAGKTQGTAAKNDTKPDEKKQDGATGEHRPGKQNQTARTSPGTGRADAAQPWFPGRAPSNLIKIATYAVLLVLGLILIIKNRRNLLVVLRDFWRALQKFWSSLFGGKQTKAQSGSSRLMARPSPSRPFSAFTDPFATGEAKRMPLPDLVIHTFRALEAWAVENHGGRRPEQTPFEFAQALADSAPDLASEAQEVTRLFVHVAYAGTSTLPACEDVLEILWSKMNLLRAAASPAVR